MSRNFTFKPLKHTFHVCGKHMAFPENEKPSYQMVGLMVIYYGRKDKKNTWKTNTRVGITSFTTRNSNSHHQDYLLNYMFKKESLCIFFPGWGLLTNTSKRHVVSRPRHTWCRFISCKICCATFQFPIIELKVMTSGTVTSFTLKPAISRTPSRNENQVYKAEKLVNFIHIRFTHILPSISWFWRDQQKCFASQCLFAAHFKNMIVKWVLFPIFEDTYYANIFELSPPTWRIIPASKWLITMVSKSPK